MATWQRCVGCLVELTISALGGVPPRNGAVPWGGHSQAPTPDAAGPGTFLPPAVWSTLGQAPAHPRTGEFSPHPHYHTDTARPGRDFLQLFPVHLSGWIPAIGEVETRARLVAAEPSPSAPTPTSEMGSVHSGHLSSPPTAPKPDA